MRKKLLDWCKENNNEQLLSEWDYDKNKEITPSVITYGSTKKVWWKCAKGHEWQASPNNRTGTHASGCPYCSSKKLLQGFNDLQTVYPNVAKKWNDRKNGELKASDVFPNSNKKVWWICDKGHEFQANIYAVVENEKYCPVCTNMKIISGVNDLATTHPHLMQEWDFEKNIDIDPTQVSYGKNKKVWWKCKYGHSWQATIASRAGVQKTGCPYCAGQKAIVGINDLVTMNPDFLKEWDYGKNTIKPSELMLNSNIKVWWLCEKGHSYISTVSERTRGNGCPYCAGRKVMVGYNDLKSVNPKLAKEWNYEKNMLLPEQVTVGSDLKVWWKCELGHEWQATISSRNRGNGCPICAKGVQTSLPENAIAFYIKNYFPDVERSKHFSWLGKRELDIYIPKLNLAIEFDGYKWHQKLKKDIIKDELCYKNGIALIRLREQGCPEYQTTAKIIKLEVSKANIQYLVKPLHKLFELINDIYCLTIKPDIDLKRDYQQIVENFIKSRRTGSLAEEYPEIAKQWDYEKNGNITPYMVAWGTQKKFWWICDKGHSWFSSVSTRTRGSKCPVCTNRKIIKGINDLATLEPELAKEWDYEKNREMSPTQVSKCSNKKVWWKCKHGHSWQTTIASRSGTQKTGCPYCLGKKTAEGSNDLASTHPDLIVEWDYEKNGELLPTQVSHGSDKKVWWKCKKGHSWQATISSRTGKVKVGCPICTNKKIVFGVNDLTTTHPYLMKEWDFEKNVDIDPTKISYGKNSKVWWKCKYGHSWQATIASRAGAQKTGCPHCARIKKKK